MEKMVLGRTGLTVSRTAFGALPLQRIAREEAVVILRRAYEAGIDFYDTARGYYDSESKIGEALAGVREKIVIATKSPAADGGALVADLDKSLRELAADYVDIFQFHVAKKCHRPGESDGLYDAMTELKKSGRVRFVGITAHRRDVALEAAASGLYDTVQYPFSYLSDSKDEELVALCERENVGFIAMKALAGGLITNSALAFSFIRQYGNVLPIWGIQKRSELEEFVAHEADNPPFDEAAKAAIERDKGELAGNFCRGCGYCLPCPADIELNWVVRMPQAIRRMDSNVFLSDEWRAKMRKVEDCIQCGACKERCPYELDVPNRIKDSYRDYLEFAAGWRG